MSTTIIVQSGDAGNLTVHLSPTGAQIVAQHGIAGVVQLTPADVAVVGAALAAYRPAADIQPWERASGHDGRGGYA